MSYAIIRVQKMTVGCVRGIQIHDQREKGYSHSNPDIDFEKSQDNKDLHNQQQINYSLKVRKRIKELNLPKAVRKDAIVMCQCLVTSDKEFFDRLEPAQHEKFFKDAYEFIKNRYGERNIISANIHVDEKTPHMHVNFVPVTADGRLCAKDIFKRNDLVKLHDDFWKYCNKNGFALERGESTEEKKRHLTVEEYKIKTKQQEIDKTKAELIKIQEISSYVSVNLEKGTLGYKSKDVEELKKMLESQRLSNYALEQTLQKQKDKITSLENEIKALQRDSSNIKSLASELYTLKNENRALQEYLKNNPDVMQGLEKYMQSKDRVHSEGKTLAELKEKFVELSICENKHYKDMQATKTAYQTASDSINELERRNEQIQRLQNELLQLRSQKEDICQITLKNVFKASERKSVDNLIGQKINGLKQATDDLKRGYNINPNQIDQSKRDFKEIMFKTSNKINEQILRVNEIQSAKSKVLDDYKYYKCKVDLYPEYYRNIALEKVRHITAEYGIERELNTISKNDNENILNRLPNGLKERFNSRCEGEERRKTERRQEIDRRQGDRRQGYSR